MACLGKLHASIGPGLKAIALSHAKSGALKESISKCLDDHPFDPSIRQVKPLKHSISLVAEAEGACDMEVPKSDLFATLPGGILVQLVSLSITCLPYSNQS